MTKYFGFEVREGYEGQVREFLDAIDPYYHRALVVGVHLLSQDQMEPVQDHYFTAIYATIMEMEDVMRGQLQSMYKRIQDGKLSVDYSSLEAKDGNGKR